MLSRHHAAWPTILLTSILAFAQAQAMAAEGKGDEADATTKVQKLNRYAMQLFDDRSFALAEKTLLDALAMVDKAGLGSGPAGLATNGNLAVLYSIGIKNPDKAVFHFKKALAIKPDLKMSKQRATPETEANLARAKAELAGGAKGSQPSAKSPSVEGKRTEQAAPLACPHGGEVRAGEELTLQCTTSADLKAATVVLHYKRNGEDDFQTLEMTKSPNSDGTGSWVAKVPGSDTQGRWVPVYFEARDDGGAVVALSGREDSPDVITVHGADAPPPVEEEEDEESDEEREEIDDANPLARLENERRREHQGSKGTWWISVGLGSGFGYAGGNATETFPSNKVGFTPGLAMAYLGHMTPEIGYFVGRNTAIAIAGRDQLVLGGWKGTPWGANAVLLRILFFGDDEGKTRWYFACTGGWGDAFRFQVKALVLDKEANSSGITIKDTVRGGPWVVGTGTGMHYKLSRHWRWTVDTQLLVGFSHVSAVLDITTGMRLQF